MKALICTQCGAPLKEMRQCEYCLTTFYLGPEIPKENIRRGTYIALSSPVSYSLYDNSTAYNMEAINYGNTLFHY